MHSWANAEQEREMLRRFEERVEEILASDKTERLDVPRIGLEFEFVTTREGIPVSADPVRQLDGVKEEIGDSQIEIATEPIDVASLDTLFNVPAEQIHNLAGEVPGDIDLTRLGAIPNLAPKDVVMADFEKYTIVPQYHDHHRDRKTKRDLTLAGVDFAGAQAIGLFSAMQVNLQADDLDDAIDKMNRSLMISPMLVALGGNARIIYGKDTHWNDIRLPAWELTHDLRTPLGVAVGAESRIGLPNRYFDSPEDYFERCAQRRFIMYKPEAAFEVGIGVNWQDVRTKVIDGKPVVELRSLPIQPTLEEDIALTVAYIGRLAFSQRTNEPLIDILTLAKQRHSALRYGLRGGAFDLEQGLFLKADAGLQLLGYSREEIRPHLDVLRERAVRQESPGDEFARLLGDGTPMEELVMRYKI